jgi:hypothetical protein
VEVRVAEIPVQPKRGPEIPLQPKRRSIWPWVLGLLALVLLPLFFMRDREPDTAVVPDTSALVDTSARFGGRTVGTAAGSVTPANRDSARNLSLPRPDTTAQSDTSAPPDSATRRP